MNLVISKIKVSKFAFTLPFFLVLFILNTPLPVSAQSQKLNLKNAHLGVWKIYNIQSGETFGDKSHSQGTAFAIEPTLFVTNSHVLRGLSEQGTSLQEIRLSQEGHSSDLTVDTVLAISNVDDLALFLTKESSRGYFRAAASSSLSQLKQLTAIGYPNGSFHRMNQIAKTTFSDPFLYHFTMATNRRLFAEEKSLGGSSGGPILDARGRVIGVIAQGYYNIIFGIKLEKLEDFVDDFIAKEKSVTCSQPKSLRPCLQKGMQHLRKTAQRGNPIAQYRLWDYLNERGEASESTIYLLQETAKRGFPQAQYELALSYMHGIGTNQNEFLSHKWMKQAADENYVMAQHGMGYLYSTGKMPREYRKMSAGHWLAKAKEQGLVLDY